MANFITMLNTSMNADEITQVFREKNCAYDQPWFLVVTLSNKERITWKYKTQKERDENFDRVIAALHKTNTNTRRNKMDSVKDYFKKNQDAFITIAIIVLLDNFLFEGKFRERIKSMIENVLTKTEKKLVT